MIWNENAIDYSKGVDITDYLTGIVYSEEQARQQPQEIKSRLVNKGRVIGCWVLTNEEAKECLKLRGFDFK